MKFTADLEYVGGYIRSGSLVGELADEEYEKWLTLGIKEQHEMLWDLGTVQVTDFRIEDVGGVESVEWSSDENT